MNEQELKTLTKDQNLHQGIWSCVEYGHKITESMFKDSLGVQQKPMGFNQKFYHCIDLADEKGLKEFSFIHDGQCFYVRFDVCWEIDLNLTTDLLG